MKTTRAWYAEKYPSKEGGVPYWRKDIEHKRTALIDGDIVTYSVGFAANKDPVENALHSVKIMLRRILDATEADSYRIFLTGEGNYREKLAKTKPYKGNRSGDKPVHYEAIHEYLIKTWDAEVIDGMEADDAMGIAQTESPDTTIICTTDKDLNMISGQHYNWRKEEVYTVKQPEADLFFMKQLLTGDPVDNIQGIPGIGPKKADRIIAEADNMSDLYWLILEAYAEYYDKPFEAMMEMANLLWIQRKEGVLWNPLIAEFANE